MKLFVLSFLLLLANAANAQSDDPSVGTWKMNRDKSTGITVQDMTLTVEVAGNGLRNTAVGTTAGGRPFKIQYTAYYDGQDWPVTGYAVADRASHRKIDARTSERTDKFNGRAVQTSLRVVAEDGRSMIVKLMPAGSVIYYEKQ